ncbi:MAG: ATP-dependent 6-phosphofructokinase [Candidatus Bipolaricaulota bacterium]|nr:ATP-dependent 6-phosphofructokinase [Candidatus Bipolaricaulota bacterium]
MMRAGVLSGGGDSPGINAALRSIVRFGAKHGVEVVGFLEGWRGPLENLVRPLSMSDVSGILQVGGTILGTSRTNPFRIDGGAERVLENLKRNKLDFLIAIGGDDTMGVAHRLAGKGLNVVGIPQTIDNDIAMTDYSLGFSSALEAVTDAMDRLHTTAASHNRVLILEVMGRDAGWLSLMGGVAGGADVILVPEKRFSVDAIYRRIQQREAQKKHFSIIIVAEGSRPEGCDDQVVAEAEVDAFGHARLGGIGQYLANELSDRMHVPVRVTNLAYLQRGGSPAPFDRILATRFGAAAIEFALERKFDVMTALQGIRIMPVPLGEALAKPRPIEDWLFYLIDLFE